MAEIIQWIKCKIFRKHDWSEWSDWLGNQEYRYCRYCGQAMARIKKE